MKVLYVTNMYPNDSNKNYGIFVKEQIDYLEHHFKIKPEIYFINGKSSWGMFSYLRSMFAVNLKIVFNKYDIIHVQYGTSSMFLLLNFWTPRRKLVVTYRGNDILKEGGDTIQVFLSKMLSHRFKHIIVVSEKMKSVFRKNKTNITVIPSGVNTNFFIPPAEKKSNYPFFKIIFPSSPGRKEKNHALFAEIVSQLKKKDIKVVERYIDKVSREQVREMFQTSDCLLLTSFSEGSPNVIKEALCCNLPILSTDVGDVAKNIKDLPFCFIFKDSNEAVKLLGEELYTKDTHNINLRSRIFELGLDQHTICKNIMKIYEKN